MDNSRIRPKMPYLTGSAFEGMNQIGPLSHTIPGLLLAHNLVAHPLADGQPFGSGRFLGLHLGQAAELRREVIKKG